MLDSSDELYKWFTQQVMRNLHVVFTMNPSTDGLKDRAATSPALFNRCVLNWFGDWSDGALYQVLNISYNVFTSLLNIFSRWAKNLPTAWIWTDQLGNLLIFSQRRATLFRQPRIIAKP